MVKLARSTKAGTRSLTFVLPADRLPGIVSVVGTFNGWTPGAHVLRKRSNGTASVSVAVPAGSSVQFRYLGEGGRWFDDPDVHVTEVGGLVQA